MHIERSTGLINDPITLALCRGLENDIQAITTWYGTGWFATATDKVLVQVATILTAAVGYVKQNLYIDAIANLEMGINLVDSMPSVAKQSGLATFKNINTVTRSNINFLLAICEFQVGNLVTAYNMLLALESTPVNRNNLMTKITLCKDTIRKSADRIIDSFDLRAITDKADLIQEKFKLKSAEELYLLINVAPSIPLRVVTIKDKLEWMEIRVSVNARCAQIFAMVQSEQNHAEFLAKIEESEKLFEKHHSSLLDLDIENYCKLSKLRLAVTLQVKSQSLQFNRENIHTLLQEIPFLLEKGDIPKATKDLMAIIVSAKLISAAYAQDVVQAIMNLHKIETPEYYSESMRLLNSELEQFKSRADLAIPDLAKDIIANALKFKDHQALDKVLSSADRQQILQCLTEGLLSMWHKFDRRDKIYFTEALTIISKRLSENLEWSYASKSSMLFRGYNLYVKDMHTTKEMIRNSLRNFTPAVNPEYICLPIFRAPVHNSNEALDEPFYLPFALEAETPATAEPSVAVVMATQVTEGASEKDYAYSAARGAATSSKATNKKM
jgi:hypothetical protein